MMSSKSIVIGNKTLATYTQGGGHWSVFIQYLFGLKSLGHRVMLLELLWSTDNKLKDEETIKLFFDRLNEYGLKDNSILLVFKKGCEEQSLESAIAYGRPMNEVKEIIKDSDLLWNFCASFRQPLLGMFRHAVLIDLDPGHLQITAFPKMQIHDHHSHLTVGGKMNDPDCEVPALGIKWTTFRPFVFLPLWKTSAIQNQLSPFTSITHWNWEELQWGDRFISASKRDAYLRYIDLPEFVDRPIELATYLEPDDNTGDRQLLLSKRWNLVDPWVVAKTPKDYQLYIQNSRGEISCPKPVFRELKTGWFSDRSVCYLASGRPVLAEDTGFSDLFPLGKGLLTFHNMEEAIAGLKEIDNSYKNHSKAAREIAEEFFDSDRCLNEMLEAS